MSSTKNEPKKKFSSSLKSLKFMSKSSGNDQNESFDSKNPEKWVNPMYLDVKKENNVIIETKDPFLLKLNSESNGRRSYGIEESKKQSIVQEKEDNFDKGKKRFFTEPETKQKKKKFEK